MSYLWPRSGILTVSANGQFASGAQAYFFLGGTSTPLVVYADAGFTMPQPVPMTADQNGVFKGAYIPYGAYRQRVVDQNGVLLFDNDNIDNLPPPTGGAGIVVTQDMVLQTGDPIWRPRTGITAGFVRMNGNTIGSATSGATELAGTTAQPLFLFLWNNFNNTVCPVSSGRGASAGADFTANKTIGIPSMRGLTAAGLDDMGGTAAGVLQAITTCTTNGTTTIVVVSAAGIAVGDIAIVGGVSLGIITAIVGTTITTTVAAGGSASGVTFRSSRFADATGAANTAGVANAKIVIDHLPPHNHGVTDPGHAHSYDNGGNQTGPTASPTVTYTLSGSGTTGTATTGITIQNTGGGNPFEVLQPTMIGTWYQHL